MRKFNVRDGRAAKVIDDVLDEHERLFLNFFVRIRLGQEHLDDGLDRRQRERGRSQALHQVIYRREDEHQRHLVVRIERRRRLRLLEALSRILHELVVEEVYANCCLQLVQLVLLE